MDLDGFLARLDGVKRMPSGYTARCPVPVHAHGDANPSLSVNQGKGQPIVVKCHTGCTTEAILDALGLTFADLMGKPEIVASYEYRRADNTPAYIVDRWANPKTFRVRGHLPPPAERVLYQLPAIEWARSAGAVVHVTEGEKDADRIIASGAVATTNVSGAGSWLEHYGAMLRDCHVVIWADNDAPGRLHARTVAANVRPHAASVSVVVPRYGKDVSELLDAGYGLDAADPLPGGDGVLAAYLAADVPTRRVSWAWYGYIPFGKLVMIEGDPGDGKSILTIDLVARWTSGAPMPDGSPGIPACVVCMVSAEDDLEDTIVPRLIAAGAKLDNVWLYPHGATPDVPFEFASDLPELERRIRESGARVIVFDPLPAFLASGTDTNNDMSVRKALYPLRALAMRTGCVIIVVRHLNKGGSGSKAVYRGNGSIAFTGAARCSYLVAVDPDDAAARLFACVKSNISRKPATLRYTVDVTPEEIPYLTWHGVADVSAQDALDGPQREHEGANDEAVNSRRKLREYGIAFLRDVLVNGPMSWSEIVAAGRDDGFTEHLLRLARADAGLIKVIETGGNRGVRWALPAAGEPETVSPTEAPPDPVCHLPGDSRALATAVKTDGKRQVDDASTSDDPAVAYASLPMECTVCAATDGVYRIGAPYYTVRCPRHDPYEFEAAS